MLNFPIWYKTNFTQTVLRLFVLLLVQVVITLYRTILKLAKSRMKEDKTDDNRLSANEVNHEKLSVRHSV